MLLVIYAHPYPTHSRGCAALLAQLAGLPGLEVRSLYDLYPDFDIDVRAEHAVLEQATRLVWLHPFYWYSVPALLKHWFDKVLLPGAAFGEGATLLAGKDCFWVTTTGAGEYGPGGAHGHEFAAFAPPLEMTARYCGMRWQPPFVVHDAAHQPAEELARHGRLLRERLLEGIGP